MALTLTDLSNHFGVTFRSEFIIETLGVPNTGKDKRAFLWEESAVKTIGQKLAEHAQRAAVTPATKAPKVEKKTAAADDNSDLF